MKQGTLQLPLLRFPLDLDLLNMNGKTSTKIPTKCRRCAMAKTCKKIVAEQVSKAWHPKHIFRDAYTYHKNLRILPVSSWFHEFVPKWAVSDCVVFFFRLNWGPNSNQACCCTSISTFIGKLRGVLWKCFKLWESPLDRDQNMISNFQVEV